MKVKKIKIVLLVMLCIFSTGRIYAQTPTTNAGFVQGNIWYSKDPFAEGDKIKIYTLIFNPDARELTGIVDFFDNTVLLGQKDFVIAGNGVKDISINWNVALGNHVIFGKIENAKFLNPDGTYVDANLSQDQTENSNRTVSQPIIPQLENSLTGSLNSAFSGATQNAENTIQEKVPPAISNSIDYAVNSIESIRQNVGSMSAIEAKSAEKQIQSFSSNEKVSNQLLKPWAYAELFFFSVLAFIFNNKFIFYAVLFLLIFFILRFVWCLFF